MKLQIALDRIPLERAAAMVHETKDFADVVEIGTSLIKDYGVRAVQEIRAIVPSHVLLADIKTMDEGAYEFRAAYQAGADVATVMGAASVNTISACYEVARQEGRDILIDLLETSDSKIQQLDRFSDALFCVHLPKDGGHGEINRNVETFCHNHPHIRRIAVAGGVSLAQIPMLLQYPIEVVVVGSAITAAPDISVAAKQFQQALKANSNE